MLKPKNAKTVLVVEDIPAIRVELQDVLEGEGYLVKNAANGADALSLLRSIAPPALILLDLIMPVMDGAEFLRILRADEALAHIPVVAFSAAKNEPPEGANAFLKKPIELQTLLKVVEQASSP